MRHTLEVNHVVPRRGGGYGRGCWNHLDNAGGRAELTTAEHRRAGHGGIRRAAASGSTAASGASECRARTFPVTNPGESQPDPAP